MDKIDEIEVVEVADNEELGVSYQKDEKSYEDKNVEIFDTILMNETIETTKTKLKILKDQGTDTHGVFKYFFYFFSVDQNPNCPEFVEWCVNNYSAAEGVIMNKTKSRILFHVHDSVIRKALSVPDDFVQSSQEYKEENVIHFFQESTTESKESFLKSCLKPDSEVIGLSYPIDLVLFNEETQSCITLASQFFGLDTNGYVTESLLRLLFFLCTFPVEPKILG